MAILAGELIDGESYEIGALVAQSRLRHGDHESILRGDVCTNGGSPDLISGLSEATHAGDVDR